MEVAGKRVCWRLLSPTPHGDSRLENQNAGHATPSWVGWGVTLFKTDFRDDQGVPPLCRLEKLTGLYTALGVPLPDCLG